VDNKYEVLKQIGSGAYGVVVSAIDHTTKKKYAIKKVVNAFDDLVDAKRILREIKLLSKTCAYLEFLRHENIIAITDLMKPPGKTNYNDIYIVT
jgi:mitogen-activated protein kinase 1/3